MGKVSTGKAELKAAAAHVVRHTSLKFFRETGPYGYFSNFWKHKKPLRYDGKDFATAEHLYQYRKLAYADAPTANADLAEQVRVQTTPAKAMFLARGRRTARWPWQTVLSETYAAAQAKGAAHDPTWDYRRVDVMREVVALKVEQDIDFAAKLKATDDKALEEASPYDSFWGTGKKGDGSNWLGRILMEARDKL